MSTRAAHPIDTSFPRHWLGIAQGQDSEERALAIRVNMTIDQALRERGMDPIQVRKAGAADTLAKVLRLVPDVQGLTGAEALKRAMELKRKRPGGSSGRTMTAAEAMARVAAVRAPR